MPTTAESRRPIEKPCNLLLMSKPLKVAIPIVLAAGFLAYLIYSALGLSSLTCEVCMVFNGRVECRQAAGRTRAEAIQTGTTNACALIANGRDELISCGAAQPESIMCTAP